MKTNQIMIRDVGFMQRTSDGYFNATAIISEFNSQNGQKKMLGNYSKLDSTASYIEQLKKEGIENPCITGRGKGVNVGTWMHPYLFVDFAMWLSVEFKSKVIRYVVDGLITARNEAGDYHKEMCAQILESYVTTNRCRPNGEIYRKESLMIRESVTDKTERNEMTEKELASITTLQKLNTGMIKKGIGFESRKKNIEMHAESLKS